MRASNIIAYEPLAASPPVRRDGVARLALRRRGDETVLADLYHSQPLRVLFPHAPRGDIFQAAIACVSGGLVGGDTLEMAIELGEGARAIVVGQAAEKVYRSLGPDCRVETALQAGRRGWLEFLPQETILFDGARLRRRNVLRLAEGARALTGGILVFGRAARGERFAHGLVHDVWEIRDARDRLVWKDALHLDGDIAATLGHAATFDNAAAYGSLIYAAGDAARHLETVRALCGVLATDVLRLGATTFRDLLIVRLIGRNALALREAYAKLWTCLRAEAGGLPPVLPRLWSI